MSRKKLLPTPSAAAAIQGENEYDGRRGQTLVGAARGQDWGQSPLLPADSLASLLVLPGSSEARKTTVTSGLRCSESYKRSGPLGLLVRTCLVSSIWGSTIVYLTWKVRAMKSGRFRFQLVGSAPRTSEAESSLWLTPSGQDSRQGKAEAYREYVEDGRTTQARLRNQVMWPTPRGSDGEKGGPNQRDGSGSPHLPAAVMLPTPTGGDAKSARNKTSSRQPGSKHHDGITLTDAVMFPTPRRSVQDIETMRMSGYSGQQRQAGREEAQYNPETGGQLNPTWVEWLMGFPIGWTDCEPSETP